MSSVLVPLDTSPNQAFQISLPVDGATLKLALALAYNEMAGYWILTVSDTLGNVILDSIPLVTGTWPAANILAQYGYLAIGSAYVISAGSNPDDYPTLNDLGSGYYLLWSDTVVDETSAQLASAAGASIAAGVTPGTLSHVGGGHL